ncbi:MAG: HlyD family efflux transporter periplasmic adaptor subunit [Pseudomonadota bacterium]
MPNPSQTPAKDTLRSSMGQGNAQGAEHGNSGTASAGRASRVVIQPKSGDAGSVSQVTSQPLPRASATTSGQAGAGASDGAASAARVAAPRGDANKSARPRKASDVDVANALLNLEREARQAQTEAELGYLMVNGSRVAVQYRQALLLMRSGPQKHRVVAVSSLSAIDRNSTFIRWVERLSAQKLDKDNQSKVLSFDVRKDVSAKDLDASAYPFSQIALLPLQLRDGTVFAHLMLTREAEWDERSLIAAARICETYSHSWEFIVGPKRVKRKLRSKSAMIAIACGLAFGAAFFPVPLSVLAPAEVTASDPFVVAAPIDGAIETISVDPNTNVKEGDLLFTYNDTDLRNRLELAGQAVSVAEARYQQSVRSSFADPSAKRELSIAQSELQLKASEYDYAKELMEKTAVRAASSGLVIFADKDTWTGRPVATGERIMRIADPSKVQISINIPVSDAIVLEPDAEVQLYLDSDPLNPVAATLKSASYHAQPDAAGVLSYSARARFADDGSGKVPRIGLRGTAKIYGKDVMLAYYLFRKPLAAIRQWTGY